MWFIIKSKLPPLYQDVVIGYEVKGKRYAALAAMNLSDSEGYFFNLQLDDGTTKAISIKDVIYWCSLPTA